jgi:hypothetical protein
MLEKKGPLLLFPATIINMDSKTRFLSSFATHIHTE